MYVPMRWSDMDAYQHINNVAFLGYFEMARVDLFFDQPTVGPRGRTRSPADHAARWRA